MSRDRVDSPFRNSVLSALPEPLLTRLVESAVPYEFAAGEVLCSEGDRVGTIRCLSAGHVKLTRMGDRGEEQVVRLLGPGEIFGLRPALEDGDLAARAKSLTPGRLERAPASLVISLLEQSAPACMAVMAWLAHELRYSENLLMALTQRPVRRRVADVLLLLHGTPIRDEDWEPFIGTPVLKREVAQMVSAAPETVSRVLAEFAELGLISIERHDVTLLDLNGLQEVARDQRA